MKADSSKASDGYQVSMGAHYPFIEVVFAPFFIFAWELLDQYGRLLNKGVFRNLVTRAGAAHLLDIGFGAGTQITTWYLGLIGNTSYTTGPAKTDLHTSHGGWTESTAYSNGARPTLAWSAAGTGSDNVDKAASGASTFNINGTDTIKGAFVSSVSTKGSTGAGTLYSAGTFTDQPVVNTNTLNVTPTLRLAV